MVLHSFVFSTDVSYKNVNEVEVCCVLFYAIKMDFFFVLPF